MALGRTGPDDRQRRTLEVTNRDCGNRHRRSGKVTGGSIFANTGNLWENLFVVILALYPLRHIGWGLDLWDTGYNYANFTYMGMEHMDPMWLFSTYLANGTGWLLTKLPYGGTLVGMNFYTGLFVTVLALLGYFFCTRKLKMPAWIVFVGEFVAESLCWCPTALLYNYLTYVLFLGAVIWLYQGLTRGRKGCLVAAGVCLGANVLVRFSNLPQMGLILAVWAYDLILWMEGRKRASGKEKGSYGSHGQDADRKGTDTESHCRKISQVPFWRRLLGDTFWCLVGYLGALLVLFSYIHLRYGLGEYGMGIRWLFAMTENATDYTAKAMIMSIVGTYVENLYWVIRMGVILAAGLVLFAVAGWLEGRLLQGKKSIPDGKARGNESREGHRSRSKEPGSEDGDSLWQRVLHIGLRLLWVAVSIGMLVWLYARGFCSFSFYSYDSIWRPGPVFLMLAMAMAAVRIFHQGTGKEEKLVSGLVILVILLTSLGSNNKVLPSLNNLFVVAPYTLWQSYRFLKSGEWKAGHMKLSLFPAKGLLVAFLLLCMVQFGCFGAKFVFAEATGVQDVSATVENNEMLRGIGMSPAKARWMSQISEYVAQNHLQGREVILYGQIPSLAYYLQMPPAFNSWCDLESYSLEAMEKDMEELDTDSGKETPVIILENLYGLELEGYVDALQDALDQLALETGPKGKWLQEIAGNPAAGYGLGKSFAVKTDAKWELIKRFMEEGGYRQTFRNEKFAVYER